MLMTVTNLTSDPLSVGLPINRTLAANGDPGDSVTLGITPADLYLEDEKGKPAFKALNLLIQSGQISIATNDDPDEGGVLAGIEGSEPAVALKLAISFATLDAATLYTVPDGKRLLIEAMLWEATADWTGGTASAIGASSDQAPHDTQGDLLGGAGGDVEATLTAAAGVQQGTIGTSFSATPKAVVLDSGSVIRFDRIVDAFTAGTGFIHVIGRWI